MAMKKKDTKVAEIVEDLKESVPTVEPEAEDSAVDDSTEKSTEKESGKTSITVDATAEEQIPVNTVKKVNIKPNCDLRFYYGAEWINLKKDVVVAVAPEVKDRLNKAGKLATL